MNKPSSRSHAVSAEGRGCDIRNVALNVDLNDLRMRKTSGCERPEDRLGLDIGVETIEMFQKELRNVRAVLGNGPLGATEGKFDGIAVRGPIPVGSIADVVLLTERLTTVEEVNKVFAQNAQSDRNRRIVKVTEDPIVTSDVIGEPFASIIDLPLTHVVDSNFVKVMG